MSIPVEIPGGNHVFDLTTRDNHRYAMWDAAYVLGSLSAVDRREFEAHMANCPACRDAVADLIGVPALLSLIDREEVAAILRRPLELVDPAHMLPPAV